ncbi:MAG: hypothetical protein HY292_07210 [Planctomycetes bacterium]|nr:hypothetical protein [Planctomycetota bacterium]
MLVELAACVVCASASDPIVAAVPNSPVQVAIPLEGFAKGIGVNKQVIIAGTIPPRGTQITILYLADPVDHTSAEWRDIREPENERSMTAVWSKMGTKMQLGPYEKFDVVDAASAHRVIESEGEVAPGHRFHMDDYHAYVVAARICIEVHVSWTRLGDGAEFKREQFDAIVKSLKVGLFRKGSFKDYPDAVIAFLDQSARHFPNVLDWIAGECTKHPNDYAPHFVLGEMNHILKEPAKGVDAYQHAIPLLKKIAKPTPQETFARIRAEHGLGLALTMANRVPEAMPHYTEAHRLAASTKSPEQASLAYVLAMGYAGSKDAPNAAKWLKEAITLEPKFRDEANKNPFFQEMKTNPAIQALLAEPSKK